MVWTITVLLWFQTPRAEVLLVFDLCVGFQKGVGCVLIATRITKSVEKDGEHNVLILADFL